jgi:hypothetical protein
MPQADRLTGVSEDTAEQCQRVRHDGVGTVIGEEMCRAVDDVAGEVVRLAAVDIEHARPDAGISAARERDGRDGEPPLAVRPGVATIGWNHSCGIPASI